MSEQTVPESSPTSNPEIAGTPTVRWDIVFLLKNYPKDYRCQAQHFMVVEVSEKSVAAIARATRNNPQAKAFFVNTEKRPLTAVVFRVDASTDSDALELGKHQLEGLIDGLSILLDRNLPKICPFVQVRRLGEPDSMLVETRGDDWAYFNPKEDTSDASWREYQRTVLTSLTPFFNIAASLHPNRDSSLSRQLLYSMKMYRHGAITGVFGLDIFVNGAHSKGWCAAGSNQRKNCFSNAYRRCFQPDVMNSSTVSQSSGSCEMKRFTRRGRLIQIIYTKRLY